MNGGSPGGYIELIIGAMGSEKTSTMNSRIRKYVVAKKKYVCIKRKDDVRNGLTGVASGDGDGSPTTEQNKPLIESRDGTSTPATTCGKLLSELDEDLLERVDVIGIDEGQFFLDIDLFADKWANKGKFVIITMLNSSFQRAPFSQAVSNLYALAEYITKLSAICTLCGNEAHFTKRLTEEGELEVIGGDDKYTALCRTCFFK
jgi:thymidine kinase